MKFIDEPVDTDCEQPNQIENPSSLSPSFIRLLARFYRNQGENELRQRFTFHLISEKNHGDTSDATTINDNHYKNKKIKTLWIKPFLTGSSN
jgi:hypothetical protein